MITNTDVFNALKTLEVFCESQEECRKCFLGNTKGECALCDAVQEGFECGSSYAPCFWDVESLRPLLDSASTTLDN